MAIRDITYLKSRFQNGDTPDENDFGDLFDTMFALAPPSSPLVVEFRGIIIVDPNDPQSNLDFEVDVSTSSSFSPLVAQGKSKVVADGWEYWNGVSMQAMSTGGLHPSYQNEDVGLVTYTWSGASRGVAYYVRYRSGFSEIWGDYRVAKVTV